MHEITRAIRSTLQAQANSEKAGHMQKYMKSEMPFYGVQTPAVRKICRTVFRQNPIPTQSLWHEVMLEIWHQATHREERYAAINLSAVKAYRPFQTMDTLAVYGEVIVDGAWWDFTDSFSNRMGELLLDFPVDMKESMINWSEDESLWKRRSSIICQLMLKDRTNESLLFRNVEANMHDTEFFIRKGIGWALRNHAKVLPNHVIAFVTQHRNSLSALSKKEGLRILLKEDTISSIP